jgi:hypothetical protein
VIESARGPLIPDACEGETGCAFLGPESEKSCVGYCGRAGRSCRRFEVPAPPAASSELQIEAARESKLAGAPLLPKFVQEVAAMDHELQKRGAGCRRRFLPHRLVTRAGRSSEEAVHNFRNTEQGIDIIRLNSHYVRRSDHASLGSEGSKSRVLFVQHTAEKQRRTL